MESENFSEQLKTQAEEGNRFEKRILILDDDRWFTNLLTELLDSQRIQVTVVDNGVEGLKEIMKSDFDVILCDMMMPGLTGDLFYLAVQRTKPELCNRFIFMSGHRQNKKIEEFVRNVGKSILWKPFDLYQLLQAIKTVESHNQS